MKRINLALCAAFICSLANANDEIGETKLDKIVVSATGFKQSADENLRNVIVLYGDELREKGYSSVKDALRRQSVISFTDSGLGENIDMRGQGDKANVAVKVMIDGREINVLDNSHGVTPIDSISLENIEQIEIIPGGGSVLYGGGTRGGAINIITKNAKEDNAYLGAKLSSADYKNTLGSNFNLGIYKNLTDALAFSADIDIFNRDRYKIGSKTKGFYQSSKLYANIADGTNMTLNYNFYGANGHDSGYLSKAQVLQNPRQKGGGEIKSKTTRPEISLNLEHKFNEAWQMDALAFWQRQKIGYKTRITPYSGTLASESGSGFEDETSGVNLKAKYGYAPASYLIFGYEFKQHEAKRKHIVSYGNVGPINYHIMTTNAKMQKQTHSVFAMDSHSFSENFTLSGGARFERAEYKNKRSYRDQMAMLFPIPGYPRDITRNYDVTGESDNNYAIEITPNYSYSNSGKIYAKYERGFISPTPAQFISRRAGSVATANPYYTSDLKSETFDTFEVGLKDNILNFSDIALSLYYTKTKDEIAYAGNPHSLAGAFWGYYNIDQTRRLGAELNLAQNFGSLSLSQGVSYIDAKASKGINDGKRLPYVSKFKTNLGADYAFTKNFAAFVNFTYLSRALDGGNPDENTRQMRDNKYIKDYALTDIGISYAYQNFSLFAGVKNIFDKEYYAYQNAYSDEYLVGDGRSYYVEFKYNF